MKLMKKIVVLLSLVALVGCATLSTVRDAGQSAGISKEFNSDIELTKSYVLTSMGRLKINIVKTFENERGFNILFSKDSTGYSDWSTTSSNGEVGRVLIYEKRGTTIISVHTRTRSIYQITGTTEQNFADAIFSGLNELSSR